ncbi:MAG: helix-turn-helix domain-containing protein [Ruminococcus sp.]|nr:helix-turn-helix domain-containing protein [Ruminococcus sp.]
MNFWDIYENLCFKFGKKPNPVGKELGISSGTISQWKSGSIPSGEKLIQIAEYFNVSVDYLLGREDNYMKSYNNTDSHLDEMSATLLDDFSKLETAEKARVIVMIDDMKKAKENK